MTLIGVVTVVGAIAIAVLLWLYMRQHSSDQLGAIEKRRKDSKIVDRADYVEGMQHIPVILSLTESAIFYENVDLQAQLELARIDEVEYDDELATGKEVPNGRVLRLRSHGHTFEFVVDKTSADKWSANLPMHRMGEPGRVHTA